MGINGILMQEAATLADTPVVLEFKFKEVPKGKDPGNSITIYPITVATWFRIRPYLALISEEDLEAITHTASKGQEEAKTETPEIDVDALKFETDPEAESDALPPAIETKGKEEESQEFDLRDNACEVSAKAYKALEKYGELIFEIVCMGIHNRPGDMPKWFRETLKASCTFTDVYILFNAIFYRLGVQSFLKSITAAKAVSPISREEIIAFQENKKSWRPQAPLDSLHP